VCTKSHLRLTVSDAANNMSFRKSFGKSRVAALHGREWTRPLRTCASCAMLTADKSNHSATCTHYATSTPQCNMHLISYIVLSIPSTAKKICPFLTGDINEGCDEVCIRIRRHACKLRTSSAHSTFDKCFTELCVECEFMGKSLF